jgi:putative Mg2+ transporter-C (MgtC) family protein
LHLHIISHEEIFLRIMAALIFGCLLGIERERSEHSAGIRTHSLVSVSSCLFMIISAFGFSDAITPDVVVLDPSRIAAQVVSGIGFLGAGVIMFRQNTVSGLNTAASIWSAAAIGLCCGGAMFFAAALATFSILFVQIVWRKWEHRFFMHSSRIIITMKRQSANMSAIEQKVDQAGLRIRSIKATPGEENGIDVLELSIENAPQKESLALCQALSELVGVQNLEYMGLRRTTPEDRSLESADSDTDGSTIQD